MFRSCLDLLNEPSDLRWLETLSCLRHARQLDEACTDQLHRAAQRCSRGNFVQTWSAFLTPHPSCSG